MTASDATLGGYLEQHDRPPAFEGSDGAAYSVAILVNEGDMPPHRFSAALLFVRWSADGAQPVGHLETAYLCHAAGRSEVRAPLLALPLAEVKAHLERLIEAREELPDW